MNLALDEFDDDYIKQMPTTRGVQVPPPTLV